MRAIILLFTTCLSSFTTSQKITKFEWPKNEITQVFKEFVKVYNTNDLKTLEAFTTKHYEKDYFKKCNVLAKCFC